MDARPPFDPEAALELDALPTPISRAQGITPADIRGLRADLAAGSPTPEDLIGGRDIVHEQFDIAGFGGDPIVVSVFRRGDHARPGPGVLWIHGGGMIAGGRFSRLEECLGWVERHDAVLATVEYRLAPEHPHPVPFEDSYAALAWFAAHAGELGFDPERLLLAGGSAGGGIAAAVALGARDRGGPGILAQLLRCPMLDDRNDSDSARQFEGVGVWDRTSNETGWSSLLGQLHGTDEVPAYAAPARAESLGNLPPTFLDVGSAELFRDEVVDYARRIWAEGGRAELHVWTGGYHGFDLLAPASALAIEATRVREAWVDRILRRSQRCTRVDGAQRPARRRRSLPTVVS